MAARRGRSRGGRNQAPGTTRGGNRVMGDWVNIRLDDGTEVRRRYGYWKRDSRGRFTFTPDDPNQPNPPQQNQQPDLASDVLNNIHAHLAVIKDRYGDESGVPISNYIQSLTARLRGEAGGQLSTKHSRLVRELQKLGTTEDLEDIIANLESTWNSSTSATPLTGDTTPPIRKTIEEALMADGADVDLELLTGMGLKDDADIKQKVNLIQNPLNLLSRLFVLGDIVKSTITKYSVGGTQKFEDTLARYRAAWNKDLSGTVKALITADFTGEISRRNVAKPVIEYLRDSGNSIYTANQAVLDRILNGSSGKLNQTEKAALETVINSVYNNLTNATPQTPPADLAGLRELEENISNFTAAESGTAKDLTTLRTEYQNLPDDAAKSEYLRNLDKTLNTDRLLTFIATTYKTLKTLASNPNLSYQALTGKIFNTTADAVETFRSEKAEEIFDAIFSGGGQNKDQREYLKNLVSRLKSEPLLSPEELAILNTLESRLAAYADNEVANSSDLLNANELLTAKGAFKIGSKAVVQSVIKVDGTDFDDFINNIPTGLKDLISPSGDESSYNDYKQNIADELNRRKKDEVESESAKFFDSTGRKDRRAKDYFEGKEKALRGVRNARVNDRSNAEIYVPKQDSDGKEKVPTTSTKKLKYLEMALELRDSMLPFLAQGATGRYGFDRSSRLDVSNFTVADLQRFKAVLEAKNASILELQGFKTNRRGDDSADKRKHLEDIKQRVLIVLETAEKMLKDFDFDENAINSAADPLQEMKRQYEEKVNEEFELVKLDRTDEDTVEKVFNTQKQALEASRDAKIQELEGLKNTQGLSAQESQWLDDRITEIRDNHDKAVAGLERDRDSMREYYQNNSRVVQYDQVVFEEKTYQKGNKTVKVVVPGAIIPRYVRLNSDTDEQIKAQTIRDLENYKKFVNDEDGAKDKASIKINSIRANREEIQTLRADLTNKNRADREQDLKKIVELEERIQNSKKELRDDYGIDEFGRSTAMSSHLKTVVDSASLLQGTSANVLPNTERHHEFNDRYVHNVLEYVIPENLSLEEYEKYYFPIDPASKGAKLKENGLIPFILAAARGEQVGFSMILNKGATTTFDAAKYFDPDYRHKFASERLQHPLEYKEIVEKDIKRNRKGMILATVSSMLKTLEKTGGYSSGEIQDLKNKAKLVQNALKNFDPNADDPENPQNEQAYNDAIGLLNEHFGTKEIREKLEAQKSADYQYAANVIGKLLDSAADPDKEEKLDGTKSDRIKYTAKLLEEIDKNFTPNSPLYRAFSTIANPERNAFIDDMNPLITDGGDTNQYTLYRKDQNNEYGLNWGAAFSALEKRTYNRLSSDLSYGKGFEEEMAYAGNAEVFNRSGHQVSTLSAALIGKDTTEGVQKGVQEFIASDPANLNIALLAQEDAIVDLAENGTFLSNPDKDSTIMNASYKVLDSNISATDEEKMFISTTYDGLNTSTQATGEDVKNFYEFLSKNLDLDPVNIRNNFTFFREHIKQIVESKTVDGREPSQGVMELLEGTEPTTGDTGETSRISMFTGNQVKSYREILSEFGGDTERANKYLYRLMTEVQQLEREFHIDRGDKVFAKYEILNSAIPPTPWAVLTP